MSTFSIKESEIKRDWYLVDASEQTLGRLSTFIATRLRGKHKPEYTPHMDTGDYIVVINAEKIKVTGNKASDKIYYRHTGFPGGIKEKSFNEMIEKSPERVLELAIKGMLPKGPLGRSVFRKLNVYKGERHPHIAQQPKPLQIEA